MKHFLITIDGPAGAGKTTVSRMLADCLFYRYIDTGALYRAVAYEAKTVEISPDNDAGLENLCHAMTLKFIRDEKGTRLLSNGADITDQIRMPEITMLASAVAAVPVVREFLLNIQRDMAREKGVIFEGRDMGTVVFPNADIKFFLDASHKARSLRRYNELKTQPLEDVENDIRCRDERDSTRSLAPLRSADDAIIINSTDLSAEGVVELMLSDIKNAFL
ncbi:(d)CMP kinase [Desulfonema magnum]|uniref:Cytidylate kinase n=1 Tax=Desulfonema magnum TaxID=45655 RepID=A0A975BUN6_9BACT|nr:(d)CMP kinase [Desulfonema magnum]QTA91554.1 Cytidylate kinase [Desulfonema magnum]